jgi:hypothetical protein
VTIGRGAFEAASAQNKFHLHTASADPGVGVDTSHSGSNRYGTGAPGPPHLAHLAHNESVTHITEARAILAAHPSEARDLRSGLLYGNPQKTLVTTPHNIN